MDRRQEHIVNGSGQGQAPISRPEALRDLLSHFQAALHMPETGAIAVVLGAYVANVLRGDPVWLVLVGPPSSGKSEILGTISGLPHLFPAATLTEAALLSGVKRADRDNDARGGLLREMDEFGILLIKDFTSVLSMNRDTRASLLAALREIYDGSWTRRLGVDGGKSLSWTGKMGLIGGVTQALDRHHEVMAEMGPRFVLYRLPPIDGQEQARRALIGTGKEEEMRDELRQQVQRVVGALRLTAAAEVLHDAALVQKEMEWLPFVADFASRCRSAVERDSYKRHVVFVPDPEGPARLVRSAAQLLRGLATIGVSSPRRRELVTKVLLDCIPPVRRAVLDYLTGAKGDEARSIVESTRLPTQTLRTALEDLECLGIVHQQTEGWEIVLDKWVYHVVAAYPNPIPVTAKVTSRRGAADD
jgi:hypothetical protein